MARKKLGALIGLVLGALLFWRRPSRSTEITIRRRPVRDETETS